MTQQKWENFPAFSLNYLEVKGKKILGGIDIKSSYELDNITAKQLPGGAIQLTCQPQKSYFFKDSDEYITLNLTPQVLQLIQSAIEKEVENDSESKT